ncbi:MAG: DUF4124 domain-containing protein [Deltaproteobacteria bacterium]|nr:DUF4124 domain-containing protein [Deltaproteobacteria bacterium]
MKRLLILLTLLWFWWAGPVSADIYRWTDADGLTHFSNQPPPAGVKVLDKLEETPYDADADRQRIKEERNYRIEREKLELEERKAELAGREREAQLNLEEANRRMQEAQQQVLYKERDDDDCADAFLRYGYCGPGYGYSHGGRPGPNNVYRGYYRENNSLYDKDRLRPGPKPPLRPGVPSPPRGKPQPKPDGSKTGTKAGQVPERAEDLNVKGAGGSSAPVAPK